MLLVILFVTKLRFRVTILPEIGLYLYEEIFAAFKSKLQSKNNMNSLDGIPSKAREF